MAVIRHWIHPDPKKGLGNLWWTKNLGEAFQHHPVIEGVELLMACRKRQRLEQGRQVRKYLDKMGLGALGLLGGIGVLGAFHFIHKDTMAVTFKLWLVPVDTEHLGNVILVELKVNKNRRSQKRLKQHGCCQQKHAFRFDPVKSAWLHDDVKISLKTS
jgi:hypothetical protein